MIMEVTFEVKGTGTRVTILFKNIPSDIRPEDNEAAQSHRLRSWPATWSDT
jgi:hypothetical protein